jgi:hypothetical protein
MKHHKILNASHVRSITQYTNVKRKLLDCNADIFLNICLYDGNTSIFECRLYRYTD